MISTLTCSPKDAVILSCIERMSGEHGRDCGCSWGVRTQIPAIPTCAHILLCNLLALCLGPSYFDFLCLCYFICKDRDSGSNFHTVFLCVKRINTISPLHMNFQVANFQRCERAFACPEPVPSTSGVSEVAACPPSPIADHLSALPSPTSSPSSSQ